MLLILPEASLLYLEPLLLSPSPSSPGVAFALDGGKYLSCGLRQTLPSEKLAGTQIHLSSTLEYRIRAQMWSNRHFVLLGVLWTILMCVQI